MYQNNSIKRYWDLSRLPLRCLLCLCVALLLSCKRGADTKNLPVHTLIYGGDITIARNLNTVLFDKKSRDRMMSGIAPLLRKADVALGNAEGVISEGGRFTDKGEPRPHMYRTGPKMIDALKDAGIDVVTVGNNHAGDYGAAAYTEMLDRLTSAGIGYAGGGENLSDARTPFYKKVGDTVLAVVGGDITITEPLKALPNRAGPLFFGMFMRSSVDESADLIPELTAILKEARKHAQVVVFSPHWGDNWLTEPSAGVRGVAKKIIGLGYDGIIGHSAHLFQGVELIDGKPVIYDAGNMLLDYGGGDDAHRGFLWELEFNRAGITKITGHPIWMNSRSTVLAKGDVRDKILEDLDERSKALGTRVKIENGTATLTCNPGGLEGPDTASDPPTRRVTSIRKAPSDMVLDELPEHATKVDVRYEGGIRLVGYELVVPEHSVPKGGQFAILYWTADEPQKTNYHIDLQARIKNLDSGEETKAVSPHWPGDWILPSTKWPVGKIIKDWTLFRMTLPKNSEIKYYTGLFNKKLLTPISSDVELFEDNLIPIGTASSHGGLKNMFVYLKEYEERIGELGKYH